MASEPLGERSLELRDKILRMLGGGGRGHVGAALSLVEILRVLYDDVLRFRADEPDWPDRDRLVLSKGHGCLALYALLADKGFFPEEEMDRFCRPGGMLGGHPDHMVVPGVEASTGSLGHGLSIGVGFALHARLVKKDFRTFVVLGDGECNEGSVWEGAMCAAKHGLDSLTVLVDYNHLQSYSSTSEVLELEPFLAKWQAFGFAGREVDGHDVRSLGEALGALPFEPGKPSVLLCHTVKGKGLPAAEHDLTWHHKTKITEETLAELRESMRG